MKKTGLSFFFLRRKYNGEKAIITLLAIKIINWRSQWPRDLRRRSVAARLLRLWVRIPPGTWMSVVSVVCCQIRGLADKMITRPEEPYRLLCVVVCDLETS